MTIDKTSLASQIQGRVLTAGDEGYEESLKRWGSNAERRAGFVALVESPEDISKTILWATENHLDLAIKCGGHSCSSSSSTEGGVLIDLSRLNKVKVDVEKQLAYAQGGALWSDFDAATTEHGFVSVGGTVNHTGIGGLITGGGYGYLTGLYGMAIDCLVEATIIVADGRIVKANEEENADLFWAIRGGGSNFGVVYEFVIRVFPHQGTCFGGFAVLTPDKIPGVVAAFEKFWSQVTPDTSFTVAIATVPSGTDPMLIMVPFQNTGYESAARVKFADFFALEPVVDTTRIHPYEQQNAVLVPIVPHGPRTYLKGFGYRTLSVPLLEYALKQFTSYVSHVGDDYFTSSILFEAYPSDKLTSVPFDATAFANRGTHFNCFVVTRWQSEKNDEFVKQWVKDFVAGARAIDEKVSVTMGKSSVGRKGYANTNLPDEKCEEAFQGNLPKLEKVKRKWDPKGRFNKWFPIASA